VLVQLLLLALSLPALPLLRFLHTAPSRPDEFPPLVPLVVWDIPDTTFDHGGLI
jgi:hypothetical protein